MPTETHPYIKVWFVDDLQSNLDNFRTKHSGEFLVETFTDPEEVSKRLNAGERPDALLIDVFFYPDKTGLFKRSSPEKVEKLVATQIKALRNKWFADEKYARGIKLMEDINLNFFASTPRTFPMFAYTTKAPYLLETNEWRRIDKAGAKLFLKNVLEAGDERQFILREVAIYERTTWGKLKKGALEALHPTNIGQQIVRILISFVLGGILGSAVTIIAFFTKG